MKLKQYEPLTISFTSYVLATPSTALTVYRSSAKADSAFDAIATGSRFGPGNLPMCTIEWMTPSAEQCKTKVLPRPTVGWSTVKLVRNGFSVAFAEENKKVKISCKTPFQRPACTQRI